MFIIAGNKIKTGLSRNYTGDGMWTLKLLRDRPQPCAFDMAEQPSNLEIETKQALRTYYKLNYELIL
jgi:hypothetical protein